MVDTALTDLTETDSGDISDINSLSLYGVNQGASREVPANRLFEARPLVHAVQVSRTAVFSVAHSTWTYVEWDQEDIDHVGGWEGVNSPTILLVPTDFSYARFTANINWDNDSTGDRLLRFWKHTAVDTVMQGATRPALFQSAINLVTRWIPVSSGDTFSIQVNQSAGSNLNLQGPGFGQPSWFQMELIA